MTQNESTYVRWHDEDVIVAKCVCMLENIEESVKRKTATFLLNEIIDKLPQTTLQIEDIYNLATSETRKRRWYDLDEIIRIFVELLKQCSPESRKEICIKAINFMENLTFDRNKSVEISAPPDDLRFFGA